MTLQVLLRAVEKMAKLQTLRLGTWDEGITKEHNAGLKPLQVLLERRPSVSYVDRMAVEVPGLQFHVVDSL